MAGDARDPEPGVARSLALDRARRFSDLRYQLTFDIPADRLAPIHGRATIHFTDSDHASPIVLDFVSAPSQLASVTLDGRPAPYRKVNGHIVVSPTGAVPTHSTNRAGGTLELTFIAGDDPLNRRDALLYSLFVPARAHHAFPCFDQPDLKAKFTLALTIPDDWQALSNGRQIAPGSNPGGDAIPPTAGVGRSTVCFEETAPISTYLFAFAAGQLTVDTATRPGRTLRMFRPTIREDDSAQRERLERNRDAIFDLHADALAWLERYTDTPNPFGPFDFILIPSFQFGGMEHPGAVYYNASSLLLEASATEQQRLARAHLIAHEAAHLWFGDLVTMPWFDDVWMKEVFANLMAAKIVEPNFPDVDYDLRFLLSHYPAAYAVDRTKGTHPIRQPLDNLEDAGSLYGPIIYLKAPIVMRQLEVLMGPGTMKAALREYLRRFAFGCASWPDLMKVLGEHTSHDVQAWSRAWIESSGRPTVADSPSIVARLRHVRRPERDILPYGRLTLTPESRNGLLAEIDVLPDPFARGAAWITVWEDMLDGHLDPFAFIHCALRALSSEPVEQNVQLIVDYIRETFWRLLSTEQRQDFAAEVERVLLTRMGIRVTPRSVVAAATPTLAATCFAAFRSVALTEASIARLDRIWQRTEAVPGLALAEADESALALELAIKQEATATNRLAEQLQRISDVERRARFAFVMTAASSDAAVRIGFFHSLTTVQTRAQEPWVCDGLRCLNHPLRADTALPLLGPSLEMLEEIQRTGDIFFPKNWLDAVMGGHRSQDAADVVRGFLADRPDYPVRLRRLILQSADLLFRMNERR